MAKAKQVRPAPAPSGARLRRRSAVERKKNRAAYLFVLPFVVLFAAMLFIPLVYAGYLSMFQVRIIGGESFIGVANYIRAFLDPRFLEGLLRMGVFLIVQVPIMLSLALVFALALDSGRVRGSRVLRLLIFVPFAVPGVIATLMWGYLYGNDFGPIAQVARALGFAPPDLLASGNILGSIMNIVTWSFVGYNMIIMYAALRSIPEELFEAADIDGAGQIRVAWSIKIPAIRPAILLTVIFSIIGTFQLFNEPSLLYRIAPDAIGVSFSPNFYAYNLAFISLDTNYAAAIAFLLGTVIATISYIIQHFANRSQRSEP